MAFIVKKKIGNNDYYYLNETKREGEKVVSKCLGYLGKTRKEAEDKKKKILKGIEIGKIEMEKKKDSNEENKTNVETENILNEINKIASNRGFFFQTANIYGGKAGFYTYGHLGKQLKLNFENLWRIYFLELNENFYEIQSNNILPEDVFRASGHIDNFNDPLTECKKCHFRFRADNFLEDNGFEEAEKLSVEEMTKEIKERKLKCPKCGNNEFSEVKQFNMMFPVNVGFGNEKAYLSPETAQAAYVVFLDEFKSTRSKLPLGLAIIDKAYRNEISPRQMFFRLREFTQAELQIFFNPEKIDEHPDWDEARDEKLRIKFSDKKIIEEIKCTELNSKYDIPKFYLFHAHKIQKFYLDILKIPREKFRFRELSEKERAFYNKIHFDIEVDLITLGGFKEVGGLHYRTNHDLLGHSKISKKNLEVFDENSGKKILPHVLELSFGVDRNVWTFLDVFFSVGKEGSMFKFPAMISPIKAAVFPIVKGDFEKIAREVYSDLKKDLNVVYDSGGSVGRRYARQDEIGTPYCITVDGDSLKNKDVTVRDRDTTKQIRVKISELKETLKKLISGDILFEKAGVSFS